jgi:glycosyltransferase involved in cell wall biosynthesis
MGAAGNSIKPNLTDSPGDPTVARYSIVVPVFNEAAVIGQFCRRARAELPADYELLICYDFDEDDTIPALQSLPTEQQPAGLRLIRNDLGRGVRYAIEAGMNAATASVVVVTMADLSDDWSRVLQMIELIESGADVVSASRYMKGGRQIGGPLFKRILSQTAGVTLYWIAGIPTRDPTNSYRAYSKSFLDEVQIESTAGFSLGGDRRVKRTHFGAENGPTW